MKKAILRLTVLMFLFSSSRFDLQAQTTQEPNDEMKWGGFANAGKWDSAIFYARRMEVSSGVNFGDSSFAHAVYVANYLGKTYAGAEDFSNAYSTLKRGIGLFNSLKATDKMQYGEAVFLLGMICMEIGATTEAEAYLLKASEICKKTDIRYYTQSLLNLASINLARGEYSKGELLLFKVQEIADTLQKDPFFNYMLSSCYNNLSGLYRSTGNIRKVLVYAQKADEVGKNAADLGSNQNIEVMLNLGQIYAYNGDLDSAKAISKKVEDTLKIKQNPLWQAMNLKVKAEILFQQKKITEAIDLFREYVRVAERLSPYPDDYDATLINLATLCKIKGLSTTSDSIFRKEAIRLVKPDSQLSFEGQQALAGLCSNLIDENKCDEALDSLVQLMQLTYKATKANLFGMSEVEKLQYKRGLDQVFDLLYTCLYHDELTGREISQKNMRQIFQFEQQRNSLVLTEEVKLLNKARNSKDASIIKLYDAWLNNKQILSKQFSLAPDQRIFNTDSLESVCQSLEKKVFAANDPGEGSETVIPAVRMTKNHSANIQFVRFNHKISSDSVVAEYAVLILRGGDPAPMFVHLCSEKKLMQLMSNKKGELIEENQLTKKLYNKESKYSGVFYQLLWEPMERYLKTVREIDYTTAGVLNNISFQAVYDRKNYLMDKYILRRYFSLPEDRTKELAFPIPREISIWGNMNYDSALYNVPANSRDSLMPASNVSTIPVGIRVTSMLKDMSRSALPSFDPAELLKLKVLFYKNDFQVRNFEMGSATEEKFKQEALGSKGILHISTHGFYTPFRTENAKEILPASFISGTNNPLFRCGLAFSGVNYYWLKGAVKAQHDDGILTGFEIAQLDLHNVSLVTLSACETGLGDITDNEGNLGLQRAFKLAGVSKMLVSLWQVPAKQTVELLSMFYSNWIRGMNMSEALQTAEKTMQRKGVSPFYWAGFVLIE